MNVYGWLFGWRLLEPVHRAVLTLSLHGLGYDNGWTDSLTGEEHFISRHLARADIRVCVDIGANVGLYSTMIAKHLPDTKIIAIEPSAATFERLEKNVHAYKERVTCVRTALSDTPGEAQLYSKAALSGTATLDMKIHDGRKTATETVPVTTLDQLVVDLALPRIDFIKIDTEGFEYEVLSGAQATLARFRPKYIQFEFNIMHLVRGYSLYDISTLLPEYELFRLLPHGQVRIDPKKFSSNIYMFCNIVAIRKS